MFFFGGFTHLFLPYFFPVFIEAEQNPYPDNPDSFLFFAEKIDTKPIEAEILTRSLHKALEKIGVDEAIRKTRNITFHSWRHWLNSLLINSKIPIQKIQSITGHLTSDMSQHYYHIDEMNDVLQVTGNIFSEHVH